MAKIDDSVKKKVPELRFKGFTDEWEERKLGDITKISTGKLDANAMVENGKYDFYTSGIKKYRIDVAAFEGPSITIAGNGATVGYMHLADNKFNAYQRTYVLQEFLVDRSFIFSEIGNKLPKKIKQEARTGNIPYIVMDMLTELKVSIPQNDTEQKKIGDFFKQLDDTITLHQRKLAKLKELKQGYLQKMFPKNGSKFPQLRFAGFADAWVQRKLGEHSNILTGGTPKTSMSNYWNPKEIPWMSSGEVNKRRINETDNMISKEGLENSSARWVKENSIVIALAGQGKTRGTVAVNNIPLTTNQSIAAIEPDETLNFEFIFQNLSKRYDELRMMSSGDGTRGGLNKKIIDEIIIAAPILEEQEKIGSFFKQLDNTIALHQRKLDLLKEQKKGYLQKMFV